MKIFCCPKIFVMFAGISVCSIADDVFAQKDFEKYYNRRSDDYNNLSADRQNGTDGLAIMEEIEAAFDKLPEGQHRKFLKRMGDTYLGMSATHAAQNNTERSLSYLQKSADAGFNDTKFIAKVKEFDRIRDHTAFKKIIGQMKNAMAAAQPDLAYVKISSKLLKKDLSILKESLEEAHQGMYQYRSKQEINDLFADAKSSIMDNMTTVEFFKIISHLVASIKDGHTGVRMPTVPPAIRSQIPIGFKVIGRKIVISKCYDPKMEMYVGAEVDSINQASSSAIIEFALRYFSSDGDNVTHKMFGLSNPKRFSDVVTILSGRNEKFDVIIKDKLRNTPLHVMLDGITRDSLDVLMNSNSTPPATLNFLKDSMTAILTIRTFSIRELESSDIRFTDFLRNSFESMEHKNIRNLILDLRGNGGGEDAFGRLLYSYFAEKEFQYYESLTLAKNKYKLFDYVEGGQRTMPEDFGTKNQSGTYDVTKKYNANVGIQVPSSPTFTGNIYALIDGGCFSTTSEFLSHLHANTKARFIGEESGGNYYTNSSGIIADVVLPNCQLQVSIPMLKYTLSVRPGYAFKNNGVLPHDTVTQSARDIISNTDASLNYAIKLISDNK